MGERETDRLAEIEARAMKSGALLAWHPADGPNRNWRDDVLALVEIAKAARNLIEDVDEVLAERERLHATQQKIGAVFLGYGGGWNHEDDLRSALARLGSGEAAGGGAK